MIEIRYCQISALSDQLFHALLPTYPAKMQQRISRYKFMADRKRSLAAREIVKEYLNSKGYPINLEGWTIDANNKPFIPAAPAFNISHSADMVVVAFSDRDIGIDVEVEGALDTDMIIQMFHREEIDFLDQAADKTRAFFNIWVRKEAYLKATGIGILQGLNSLSVLPDAIEDQTRKWFLQNTNLWTGYQCAICTPYSQAVPQIVEHRFNNHGKHL